MTRSDLLALLRDAPLIASVQASEGSPVDDPDTLLKLALASLSAGVRVLRLEGVENICHIKAATGVPVIGLIKRRYPGSEVYITPTLSELDALIETGCEVVALDATQRSRPGSEKLPDLIGRIHAAGRLAMADCDSLECAQYAVKSGADIIGTTLSGYTDASAHLAGPALDLVRAIVGECRAGTFAEGRYSEPWQVRAALRAGAGAVVVGGALNDPVKQTAAFLSAAKRPSDQVGAIDIGGTWLRAGLISPDGHVSSAIRTPLPQTRLERNAWINDWLRHNGIRTVGIGAGGIIHPESGEVLFSKPIIPDHIGTIFTKEIEAERVVALNDGHATAWGHAMHPSLAGMRVATLALGTGVGFGLVDRGRILMGHKGEHPRINDTPTRGGKLFDDLLGGAAVTATPTTAQIADAIEAAEEAVRLINTLYYPDVVVIAGGIGLQPWMDYQRLSQAAPTAEVRPTPYGSDAGLVGAGSLALYPPPR